jgi:predicted short-subunit dehydrogenase-like oxidoreductase (DUF2520 family)
MSNENVNSRAGRTAPRIVMVGSGRLAQSILRTMHDRVVAIIARKPNEYRHLRAIAPGIPIMGELSEIDPATFDILWILTADDAIASVAARIADTRATWRSVTAIHSSGATSPDALEPLAIRGARTIALHPNGSFTGEEPLPPRLLWSISASDADSLAIARDLLAPVVPRLVVIDDAMRPLYHAAASVASNYSVTLFAMALDLYMRAGLQESDARDVVASFIAGSAGRAASVGPIDALTGPIARGDADVLARQTAAVARHAPDYLDAFNAMARATAMLALERRKRDDDGGYDASPNAPTSGTPDAQSGQDAAS